MSLKAFTSILIATFFLMGQTVSLSALEPNPGPYDENYTFEIAKSHELQYFDGGHGIDTLKIRITKKDYLSPMFFADIIRFTHYLQNNIDPNRTIGKGEVFTFGTYNLQIRNIEALQIEVF